MQILGLATTHIISFHFNRHGLTFCTPRFTTDRSSWARVKAAFSTILPEDFKEMHYFCICFSTRWAMEIEFPLCFGRCTPGFLFGGCVCSGGMELKGTAQKQCVPRATWLRDTGLQPVWSKAAPPPSLPTGCRKQLLFSEAGFFLVVHRNFLHFPCGVLMATQIWSLVWNPYRQTPQCSQRREGGRDWPAMTVKSNHAPVSIGVPYLTGSISVLKKKWRQKNTDAAFPLNERHPCNNTLWFLNSLSAKIRPKSCETH